MTLHQLKIFAAVARHLNVTKASEELCISQPSVSQQLKLLEEEYELKLYKKVGRGIKLTEKGRLFLKDAEPILNQVNKLKERFGNSAKTNEAVALAVGASYTPVTSFFPMLLAAYKEAQPQIQIVLRNDRSRVLEELVANSQVEIALITAPTSSPMLTYEAYRPMRVVAFASAKYPLARRQQWTLEDLAQAPLIVTKDPAGERISRAEEVLRDLENKGFKLNIFMHCDSPQAVKAAVKTGVGIGLLFEETLEPELTKGELKILKTPDLKVHFDSFIIYHKEKPLSPHAQEFLALLRDWPQKNACVKTSLRAV